MLQQLGWELYWDDLRRSVDPDCALSPVRIISEHRGAYHASDSTAVAWVELTGRAFHRAQDKRELPTVGDWVMVERWADAVAGQGAGVIRHVLGRKSLLVRKAAGEATLPQPVAANVDTGIVMTSANKDLSPKRIDRYLTLLRDGGITPVLVLSKIDLVADPQPLLAELRAVAPSLETFGVSTITGAGIDAIRSLGGTCATTVLLGSSGVGKSSLLNAVLGEQAQLTQPIRDDERGKHTTTRRELFATDRGLWIDTPGMRELAQWIDDTDDDTVFDDITAVAEQCKFRDCQHGAEPGCAVRAAVEAGTLPADRLASFHKLAGERVIGAHKQEAARRLAETRKAKAKRYAPRPGKPDDER
ncbi:MAG TPA: ribosome small subunit-dependent GTPase A [Kofleriaceae bacterium]